jgi:hypothetical protein
MMERVVRFCGLTVWKPSEEIAFRGRLSMKKVVGAGRALAGFRGARPLDRTPANTSRERFSTFAADGQKLEKRSK